MGVGKRNAEETKDYGEYSLRRKKQGKELLVLRGKRSSSLLGAREGLWRFTKKFARGGGVPSKWKRWFPIIKVNFSELFAEGGR